MDIAYFNEDGRCIAVSAGQAANEPYPGAVYSAEVPEFANPNHIYMDVASGDVILKAGSPIVVTRNLITGIPAGTELRVAGRAPVTVDSGEFAFDGEEEGNRWVRLTHPLYLDWAGNVPVGPAPE